MPPAARILDMVAHPLPPMLTPGPGSVNVFIAGKPAWRGVPAAVAGALSAAKQVSDSAIQAAEAATMAAAGTPGLPAAKAAEEATKAACAASMGSAITAAAGMADIHMCTTPLPFPPHGPGVVIDGSSTVLINNMCACRQGDTILEAVGPPNKIVLGCFTVFIGNGSGGGAATGAPAAPAVSIGMIGNMPIVILPNGDIKVGEKITLTGDIDTQISELDALKWSESRPEASLDDVDRMCKLLGFHSEPDGGIVKQRVETVLNFFIKHLGVDPFEIKHTGGPPKKDATERNREQKSKLWKEARERWKKEEKYEKYTIEYKWLDYIRAIDFHSEVTIGNLPSGFEISRHEIVPNRRNRKRFTYYTVPGTSPRRTGTSFEEKIQFKKYEIKNPIPALSCRCSDIRFNPIDNIERTGGGLQLIIANRDNFHVEMTYEQKT